MCKVKIRLTVFFEDPFWVGIYERSENSKLEACRVVFGAEPKDYEVYDCFLKNWHRLRLSPPVTEDLKAERKINPKRMQRAISDELGQKGIGTKAQQALKMQQEQNKLERKTSRKKRNEEEEKRQFEIHKQKKKDKQKGR